MIPIPRQPYKRYGLGAVNYHTSEIVVLFQRCLRCQQVAELLQTFWLNPIEMRWRYFRPEVTHCKLFASFKAL